MLFKDLKDRKLVSTSTADTLGKVDGFLLDPAQRAVVALEFKKTPEDGSVIMWTDLKAVGEDAVTVESAEAIKQLDEAHGGAFAGKDHAVLKKRVLTRGGDELGTVSDVDFDPTSGSVVALVLSDDKRVEGSRLLGVGSYAVVVEA